MQLPGGKGVFPSLTVDQKKIERMIVTLELVEGFLLIGANHIGDILRGVKIADAGAGMLRENKVADRMDQVRLAKTHATVDEQRVVRRSRMFGDLQRRGAGELVGFAGDKIVETKFGNEARAVRVLRSRRHRARGARRGRGGLCGL